MEEVWGCDHAWYFPLCTGWHTAWVAEVENLHPALLLPFFGLQLTKPIIHTCTELYSFCIGSIVGVSSILTKLIIQHKFHSYICIEITHNILILSRASCHYLLLICIAVYCCETNVFWLIRDLNWNLFIVARMHPVPPSHVHARKMAQQSRVCSGKNVHAINYYEIRCSMSKQAAKRWMVSSLECTQFHPLMCMPETWHNI